MAMTAAPFSPHSSFRNSQSQSSAPTFSYSDSPLTQLPQPDFNFDDLRKRMADFTAKFDAYIERGRKRVLEDRNSFRAKLSELHEEQSSAQTQISSLESSLASHDHVVAREASEKSEMQSQISQLESHAAASRSHREALKSSIAATQRQIDAKLAAQREYAKKMDIQARQNTPELTFWETYLGCRIEGGGDENIVRVFYSFPPAKGSSDEREATFELHVPDNGSGGYEVVHSKPKLEKERVEKIVNRLNETRDVAVLLKGMRGLFAEDVGERMIVR